jgi:hypothetical protein
MLLRAAFDSMTRVRQDFDGASFAIDRTLALWNLNPSISDKAMELHLAEFALRRSAANLEVTFVLRLFAEFEGILRNYWLRGMNRQTDPPMQQLMDAIAADRNMNATDLVDAHDVRTYRNDIIHESLRTARIPFVRCSTHLGRYLRWLPQSW